MERGLESEDVEGGKRQGGLDRYPGGYPPRDTPLGMHALVTVPSTGSHRAILQPEPQDAVPDTVALCYLSRLPHLLGVRNPHPVVLTDRETGLITARYKRNAAHTRVSPSVLGVTVLTRAVCAQPAARETVESFWFPGSPRRALSGNRP